MVHHTADACGYCGREDRRRALFRIWSEHLPTRLDEIYLLRCKSSTLNLILSRSTATGQSLMRMYQRGLPSWMGRVLADGTQKLSVDYVGRQKVNAETGTLE